MGLLRDEAVDGSLEVFPCAPLFHSTPSSPSPAFLLGESLAISLLLVASLLVSLSLPPKSAHTSNLLTSFSKISDMKKDLSPGLFSLSLKSLLSSSFLPTRQSCDVMNLLSRWLLKACSCMGVLALELFK